MKFHKEGYPSLALVLAFGIGLVSLCIYFFPSYPIIHFFSYLIAGFLLIVILQFFRDPKKELSKIENAVISPCDGKVVVIEEVEESEHIKGRLKQVSIFMSPINVHNNRYPIDGTIDYYKYHPGKFLVAWHPKSSTENERTTVVVKNKNGKSVLFRQIAGALARRIVFYGNEGEQVEQSEECGFIKFGSRVDLLLPLDSEIKVQLGDKVTGGISQIANL